MILNELSKSLPLSLNYLDLNLVINPNDLQNFLKNFNQINLKRLLIRNRSSCNLDITLNILKEFIKENNSLDSFSYCIRNNSNFHNNLELLVKEIQSFVRMKSYDDLVIKVDDDGKLLY
ncbi:hypothetical protein C1645_840012 [Glomus cerebriforme]|uniref:F-box domain-containing protein n=1 Tax=Glomus cerebriforme TaxID=658196 RepID=A0A397SBL7_9GLOM|nr:hypothetical protein C1645_840012 [Glomus cerebriforme]